MKVNLYISMSAVLIVVDSVFYMFISFVSTLLAYVHLFSRSTMEIG